MYVTKQYDKEDLLIYRLYLCILSGSMDNNANDKKKLFRQINALLHAL